MANSKLVMSQVQKLQIIMHEIHAEGMTISESFQKDFKNYLKHKLKKMGLEDLIIKLQIKEDNRMTEIKTGRMKMEVKANLVKPNSNMGKKRKRQDTS
ncbi:hypothetical protein CDL12_13969 [Handroanthus impetiginosus]|uniref:Uncharacterized protein n=1 Tax=Handroanthus impetiginosus TaxID=429701 RepID=A0A2G9H7W6_9LAMI|nr:hypothetical protein CDL12_13969 [Handroanthus impetiginosus]